MKSPETPNTSKETQQPRDALKDSSSKTKPEELTVPSEVNVEMQQLDIERKKLDIESEKLALEKTKDRTARRLGMLPTIVSLFAILLTAFTTFQNSSQVK